jgi:hypothetical protein
LLEYSRLQLTLIPCVKFYDVLGIILRKRNCVNFNIFYVHLYLFHGNPPLHAIVLEDFTEYARCELEGLSENCIYTKIIHLVFFLIVKKINTKKGLGNAHPAHTLSRICTKRCCYLQVSYELFRQRWTLQYRLNRTFHRPLLLPSSASNVTTEQQILASYMFLRITQAVSNTEHTFTVTSAMCCLLHIT